GKTSRRQRERQRASCLACRAPGRGRRKGPGLAGVGVDLPTGIHLPQGLHRQPEEPVVRGDEQPHLPPAPGEGEAPRGQGQLHAVPGRALVLPLPAAHRHRHLPDVLLPAHHRTGLGRHRDAGDVDHLRPPRAQHAPMGRAPHGALCVPAHVQGLLPRGVQAAPGVQLGHRGDPADPHPAAVLHRLPAALGPARSLGGHRGHEHDGVHTSLRIAGEIRAAGRGGDRRGDPPAMVCAPRVDVAVRDRDLHGHPLLARPQGRRHLRAIV
ncbi:MAG: Cytochrome b/b6-like, partial [uncultured Acidimicrobiales bacterium]